MSRGLASANVTASQAVHVLPVMFASIAFDSGTVRVHDSVGTISFGGNNYLGGGAFVSISPIEESDDRTAHRVWLRLNATDQDIIDEARAQEIWRRKVTVYLGFLDSTGALVETPDVWDTYWCDNFQMRFSHGDNTITLNAESDLVRDFIPNGLMFSDEDHQKSRFSGDTGFSLLAQMVNARVFWGPGGRDETAGYPAAPGAGSRRSLRSRAGSPATGPSGAVRRGRGL